MASGFPIGVRQFIQRHIESVAQLEMLMLLCADPSRTWNASDVAKTIYSAQEMCEVHLSALNRDGLLSCTAPPEVLYQYQPASADLDRQVEELAGVYQERRVAVITEVYSKPVNSVQTFADAFRLRKEK